MLNVAKRGQNVRVFVKQIQYRIFATLACHSVIGEIRENRVSIWIERRELEQDREDKIARYWNSSEALGQLSRNLVKRIA